MTVTPYVGQVIPNTKFSEVEWSEELAGHLSCGLPQTHTTHELFKGKKVVIVSIPGSFTTTCSGKHLPPYIERFVEFKQRGYEVYCIAQNDPHVQFAFGKILGAKGDVHFATDIDNAFSRALNATLDFSTRKMGERTGRYALVADDLIIKYFGNESESEDLNVSSVDAVLPHLE